MPYATTDDGVRLFYEETGSGFPILFIHEFAGDHRSWEPQVRRFSPRHRCITYNARGYPPSDVPEAPEAYSQRRAVADAVVVLDSAGVKRAHLIGLSMGGFCVLHMGLEYPGRCTSLVVAATGYGADPAHRESFQVETEAIARAFAEEGSQKAGARYSMGPARVQLLNKQPQAWAEFNAHLAEHSALGSALTMRGVQKMRPSLYDLTARLSRLEVPTLVITGDEDEGCLDPNLMLKRTIPAAALVVLPRTGHTCNLEDPDLFNRVVHDFLSRVESGRWTLRDPRSVTPSLTGMDRR